MWRFFQGYRDGFVVRILQDLYCNCLINRSVVKFFSRYLFNNVKAVPSDQRSKLRSDTGARSSGRLRAGNGFLSGLRAMPPCVRLLPESLSSLSLACLRRCIVREESKRAYRIL